MSRRTQLALALLFAAPLMRAESKPEPPALSPELLARLRAEAPPSRDIHRPRRMWKTSLAVMAAASAADLLTSVGKRERNPLLQSADGRFRGRGILIKSALTGGAITSQMLLLRKNPEAAPYAAVANFALSGLFTSVAVHNLGNSRARPAAAVTGVAAAGAAGDGAAAK